MREYLPLIIPCAIIGVFTLVFLCAYAVLKKKTARLMLGHSPAHGRWPRPSTRWYGKYFGRMASS